MTSDIFLSVVVPAYNEEQRIIASLESIYHYFEQQSYTYELIVVDDGSVDRTVQMVSKLLKQFGRGHLLQNTRNRGKGYSVRQGVLASCGEYVLFSDADLSTPISEVEKLLAVLKGGDDIAIGSRAGKNSQVQVHQPWYREYMGKTFNVIIRMLILSDFHDTQCGFKCFHGEVARRLFAQQTIDHYSFDVEILFLARLHHYRVQEIPVLWFDEPNTRVNAITDSARMLKDVVKIRYNAMLGKYPKSTGRAVT